MNKKILSAAVLLGLSSAATAVNLNPDGMGQVLLYPYYTTNGSMQTQVTVVNTTNRAKAVKVRFIEGVNSWEVLDFNLYLSPYDLWSGVVFQDSNGQARLGTADTSCIVPSQLPALTVDADGNVGGGIALMTTNMDNWSSASGEPQQSKTGLSNTQRLTEGYLEVIEMGTAVAGSDWEKAVTHVQGTGSTPTPKDCSVVVNYWAYGGTWDAASNTQMTAVSGGLFGSARIINAAIGIDRAYDAIAIDGFWAATDPETNTAGVVAHSEPGDSMPDIAGNVRTFNGNARTNKGNKTSYVAVSENNVTEVKGTTFAASIDAVSSLFMVDKVYNQFFVADFAKAETDWVITFPTKHPYVNPDTAGSGSLSQGQYGLLNSSKKCTLTRDTAGFCQPFDDGFDVRVESVVFGEEEQSETPNLRFSPSTASTLSYEVNVLSFDEAAAISSSGTNVFNSRLGNRIKVAQTVGWARVDFNNGQIYGTDTTNAAVTRYFNGVPAIGFSSIAAKVDTGSLNYGELYNHKYTRNISS